MKWNDVRITYPDKFILLTSLKEHIKDNKKCIDDVAVVKILDDDEATGVLIKCKGKDFVYHTSKEKLEMEVMM